MNQMFGLGLEFKPKKVDLWEWLSPLGVTTHAIPRLSLGFISRTHKMLLSSTLISQFLETTNSLSKVTQKCELRARAHNQAV